MIVWRRSGLLGHDSEKTARVFRVDVLALHHRLDESLNRRNRRLQLVRDIRNKIATDTFQPAQIRDVIQDHDHANRPAARILQTRCLSL